MPRLKNRKKRRGRPGALSKFTATQLAAEINRRRNMLSQLLAAREKLSHQLELLNHDIADIESAGVSAGDAPGSGPGRPTGKVRRGRGGNKQSLPSLLHSLLRGKTMSVPELAVAAKKAGHRSKSKNFRKVVSLALLMNRPMFKRVSRGQYTTR